MGTEEPAFGRFEDLTVDPGVLLDYQSARGENDPLELGAGATVRSNTVLYSGSKIGDNFATGHNVVVREECVIGDDVSIWSNSIIDYGCDIGADVKIHSNCYVAQFTTIGPGAFLAPGVSVANDLYPGSKASAEVMAGPVIGAGAQIGVGARILPYVRIGEGALIGSGAVVTRDVPAGMVAVGNPAVVTKPVSELKPIHDRLIPDGERFRISESDTSPQPSEDQS